MQCIGNVPKTCAANNSHGHHTQHAPDVNLVDPGGHMCGQIMLIDPSRWETGSSDNHAKLALPTTAKVMSPTMRQMSICWPRRKKPFEASLKFTRAAAG